MRIDLLVKGYSPDAVYLTAIDRDTREPITESEIVPKRRLVARRDELATELCSRADVTELFSPELEDWMTHPTFGARR